MTDDVIYVEESGGFRHRMLKGSMQDGYQAALEQLIYGELLYRVTTERGPEIIPNQEEFDRMAAEAEVGEPDLYLMAGIPKASGTTRTVMRDGRSTLVDAVTGDPVVGLRPPVGNLKTGI
jgi:hypothetical protein